MSLPTNDQIRAEVEKAEARFEETYPDTVKSGKGRRATIRSMAFQHVAEKFDMKLGTVAKKWQRARGAPRRHTKRERDQLDYLGVDVSEAYRRMLGSVLNGVRTCQQRLMGAKGALAAVAARHPFPEPKLKQWLEEFDSLAQRTRGLFPVGLCPWCKNTKTYRPNCAACFGTGYMMRAQLHAVPARLKEPGIIIQHGHERRVKELEQHPDAEEADSLDELFPVEE